MAVPEHSPKWWKDIPHEYLRRDLRYLRQALFAWCRKLDVPLMSPPRAPEALDALGAEVERLREDNKHLRTMLGKVPEEQLGRIMSAVWAERAEVNEEDRERNPNG